MIVIPRSDAESVPVWFDCEERLPVLAVMLMPTGGPKLLLWSKKQATAALFSATEFVVSDATLPTQWIARIEPNGHVELSPREWQTNGFWERYHNEDPAALKIFERCREALMEQQNAATEDTAFLQNG